MRTALFIGGRYVEPQSQSRFTDIEPATERALAQVAGAGASDAGHAVARRARLAWPARRIQPDYCLIRRAAKKPSISSRSGRVTSMPLSASISRALPASGGWRSSLNSG
jgi:hypothetical protein